MNFPSRSDLRTPDLAKPPSAFTLVEVALALAMMSFALLAIMGLLSAGMMNLRTNYDRSIESRILDWVRSRADAAQEGGQLQSFVDGTPYGFDESGVPLSSIGDPQCVYSAKLAGGSRPFPGSAQALAGVTVAIHAHARNDQSLGHHALWFHQ